jgi:hypothetical protein
MTRDLLRELRANVDHAVSGRCPACECTVESCRCVPVGQSLRDFIDEHGHNYEEWLLSFESTTPGRTRKDVCWEVRG